MTELNGETCELTINELDEVSGGSWFGTVLAWGGLETLGRIVDAAAEAAKQRP